MEKDIVTWKQVEDYIDNVAERIKDLNMAGIFTFPRGGLVLATLLSYKTDLPILLAPCDNCVIIDDICDTGITLKKYSDLREKKNYFITTMYIKDDQLEDNAKEYQCDIDYFSHIKNDNWVVYPWERK